MNTHLKKPDASPPENGSPGAEKVRWDLSDLYAEPAGPGIDSEMASLDQDVDSFAARYRGRVASLGSEEMARLLETYEALAERMGRASSYAQLSWATQSDDPRRGALMQKQMEIESRLSQRLVFIDLEWAGASEEAARRLTADPRLFRWRHWL
ncbi:MAG TPA: oligoendopeptidase F, partial [Spirochaetia bacterium]|nr:oligoendopeptidase F [Spirochaetia bacterium]